MRGIVLAGGTGTRLYPITVAVNKQLLPVYDKPMIYYPISVLMLAGIRDIQIITLPRDLQLYERVFGDGSQLGIRLSYAAQPEPRGLAEAFIIARDFIGDDSITLILGDNIFFGHTLPSLLRDAISLDRGGTVFAYQVTDPERFGVVTFDASGRALKIEEKPTAPESSWAVTGLYVFDNRAPRIAAGLKPSKRGELEITEVIQAYLDMGELNVQMLGRGFAWLDTGTCDSLLEASEFVRTIQHRQALPIACLEEIAYRQGWITLVQLQELSRRFEKSAYGAQLLSLAEAPVIHRP